VPRIATHSTNSQRVSPFELKKRTQNAAAGVLCELVILPYRPAVMNYPG
jgi:hypothetical protein